MSAARKRAPRRTWGGIRRLPSGRYQARYVDHEGRRHTSPHTFASKRDADAWLATNRADLLRGTWRDPDAGSERLGEYLGDWLDSRTDLAPTTRQNYAGAIERWLSGPLLRPPRGKRAGETFDLSALELRTLTPQKVRDWHAAASYTQQVNAARRTSDATRNYHERRRTVPIRQWARANGFDVATAGKLPRTVLEAWQAAGCPQPPLEQHQVDPNARPAATIRYAYAVLRAALNTAVRDGTITVNPCQLPRAGSDRSPERVPATLAELETIAAAMPEQLRAAVHVAAWSGLRAGELYALARRHVDLEAGTIRVERAVLELRGSVAGFGPPKTASSLRTVVLPPHIVSLLADHLEQHTAPDPDAIVFHDGHGSVLSSSRRTRLFKRARAVAGRDDLRWHDLRHTGATLAAQAGATTRELQDRLGHSTFQAAMRYQHATAERQRELAARMSALATGLTSGDVVPLERRPAG
jgi:integrase